MQRRTGKIRQKEEATCDLCRGPRADKERHRLVWAGPSRDELVLADLCSRCAAQADRLIEIYGDVRVSTRRMALRRRAVGFVARGLLYVLIALAFFFVVSLITSRAG
jgi:hypothetical protein